MTERSSYIYMYIHVHSRSCSLLQKSSSSTDWMYLRQSAVVWCGGGLVSSAKHSRTSRPVSWTGAHTVTLQECLKLELSIYMHVSVVGLSPTRGSSLFLGKVTALGELCWFALLFI